MRPPLENARRLCGESRKEATSPMPILSTKEISKVGTWNVRTMYEASKTGQIAKQKRAYNISILGLCEIRWTKSGQTRLNTGDTMLYSGHEEENAPHTEGMALMLSHQTYNALIGWEALGPRVMDASFKTRMEKIQLNIIQCYAPTNDKDEGTKEDFYNKLQTVLDNMTEKDITIPVVDFNEKIGSNNRGYEEVMGTHGIVEMRENGEMFADLCSFNILIIGGSVFPHRRIHKATWVSPDHRTENQIDHNCISQKFMRSMQDGRVHSVADAASDHHIVLTKLKLKMKSRVEKRKNRTRYNVDFLKDKERMETFRLTLSNKYDTVQDLLDEENMEVNPHWECVKKTSTCEEVLGKKKRQHRDWISVETINKLQVRKENKLF